MPQASLFSIYLLLSTSIIFLAFTGRHQQECDGIEIELESFVLIDLFGDPRELRRDDLENIEVSFLQAYSDSVTCQSGTRVLDSIDILWNAVDGFGDESGDVPTSGTSQPFSFFAQITIQCTDCQNSTDLLRSEATEEMAGNGVEPSNGNLRALQTSNNSSCVCLPPLQSIFLANLQGILAASGPNSAMDILKATEVTRQPGCNTASLSRFASFVLVSFQIPIGLNSDRQKALEQLFLETYHETTLLNSEICDPHLRLLDKVDASTEVEEYSAVESLADTTQVNLIVYAAGTCYNCTNSLNLFEPENSLATYLGRGRVLQNDSEESHCLCSADAAVRSVTEEEFFQEYSKALQSLSFDATLVEVLELQATLCDTDVTTFNLTVIVELEICDSGMLGDDFGVLEDLFVFAYNDLAREFCDPLFRTLESAVFLHRGALTEAGTLPIEMEVTALCRGCDPNTTSIYDIPTAPAFSMSARRERRRYLEETETCYCAADAIADRAPYEAEFVAALESRVSQSNNLTCVEGIADCEFGSIFRTALYLSFVNASTIENLEDVLEESVLSALNQLYETTDEVCNPDSRLFQNVDAVSSGSVGNDTAERRLRPASLRPFFRALQTQSESLEPSAAPSSVFLSPSLGVFGLLTISGVCDGCPSDFFFGNQAGRRLDLVNDVSLQTPRRFLEDSNDLLSFCSCPLNSTVVSMQPTLADFEGLLQIMLEDAGVLLDVQGVAEIDAACGNQPPDEFTSLIVLTIDLSSFDGAELSLEDIALIGDNFVSSYNSVVGVSCDGTFRQAIVATFDPSFGFTAEEGGTLVSLYYDVVGLCYDCDPGSRFFSTTMADRSIFNQALGNLLSPLLGETSTPTIAEVDSFLLCDGPVLLFNRTITVDLTVNLTVPCRHETGLSESEKTIITAAYVNAYNDLISDYCDPFLRRLTDAVIVRIGDLRHGNQLPIDFLISGECQGCDPDNVKVYDVPNTTLLETASTTQQQRRSASWKPPSGHRTLHEGGCICDTEAVGQRAPFETEFIDAYTSKVGNLTLDCIDSVGECDFGTQFATNVVLIFQAQDGVDLLLDTISTTFLDTANALLATDNQTCNLFNQQIITVSAQLQDFVLNGNSLTTVAAANSTRRLGRRRYMQEDHSADPTSAPTVSPTSVFQSASSRVFILLQVIGVCNGCPNDLFVGNQILRRSRALGVEQQNTFSWKRELQTGNSSSDCFCPFGSNASEILLDPDEFQVAYQEALIAANSGLVIQGAREVVDIPCADDRLQFSSQFTYTFSAHANVTEDDVNNLGAVMADVYNILILNYCDTLGRRDVVITLNAESGLVPVPATGRLEIGCLNFEATFDVTGTCLGCVHGTSIFDIPDSTSARARVLAKTEDAEPRLLQVEGRCYCDSALADLIGSPTIEEFSTALDDVLADSDIPGVCRLALPAIQTLDPILAKTPAPSESLSQFPSEFPSEYPSQFPSEYPSQFPSEFPSEYPTGFATASLDFPA